MQYGAVPIVNPVGGLANTVFDAPRQSSDPAQNGFRMQSADHQGLLDAMKRASQLWKTDPVGWQEIVQAGYRFDSSWTQSGLSYLKLYSHL